MNKQSFLAGKKFTYDGHFKRISRHLYTPEQALQIWQYNAARETIVNEDGSQVWHVRDVFDARIILTHRDFGNVFLQFKELTPVEEGAPA